MRRDCRVCRWCTFRGRDGGCRQRRERYESVESIGFREPLSCHTLRRKRDERACGKVTSGETARTRTRYGVASARSCLFTRDSASSSRPYQHDHDGERDSAASRIHVSFNPPPCLLYDPRKNSPHRSLSCLSISTKCLTISSGRRLKNARGGATAVGESEGMAGGRR